MQSRLIAVLVLAGVVPLSCTINYQSDMTLEHDGLRQTVSVSTNNPHPADGDKWEPRTFEPGESRSGTLAVPTDSGASNVPANLGTEPNWSHSTSPLGEVWILAVPRGGDVSITEGIRSLQGLVDDATETIAVWFEQNYGRTAWGPRVADLCRTDVRRDLADLVTLAWSVNWSMHLFDFKAVMEMAQDDKALEQYVIDTTNDMLRRVLSASAAMLAQRNWISPEAASLVIAMGDVPDLRRTAPSDALMTAVGVSAVQRLMERLDLHDEVAFWELATEVGAAMERDKLGERMLDGLKAKAKDDPHLNAAIGPVMAFLTTFGTEATVHIGNRGTPAFTNGELAAGEKVLRWNMKLSPWAPGLSTPPVFWSAAWARPDAAKQRRIFGDAMVIDGTDLITVTVAWQAAGDAGRNALLQAFDSGQFRTTDVSDHRRAVQHMTRLLLQVPGPPF